MSIPIVLDVRDTSEVWLSFKCDHLDNEPLSESFFLAHDCVTFEPWHFFFDSFVVKQVASS